MAIAELDKLYVSETDGPAGQWFELTITDFMIVDGKRGKDRNLTIVVPSGAQRIMTVWGDNWNKLISKFGTDTDAWRGKSFLVKFERHGEKLWRLIR